METFVHWVLILLYFGIFAALVVLNSRMQKKARTSQDHFLSPLPLARLFMMPEFYLFGILLGLGVAVGFAMTVPFRTWNDLLTSLWN